MGVGRVVWGAGLFAGACVIGAAVVRRDEAAAVDQELFDLVNSGHGAEADRVFVSLTELGSMYAAGAAALTLTILGRGDAATRAMGAAGATWVLLQGMKRVADRPRPLDADPDGTRQLIARPVGMSWPSSHPAVLTTFSRVAARELGVDAGGRGALSALDATVAVSRVYLGVHYPSDVLSGLLIGRAVARLWPRGRA
ncbi:MAG: phosphatase PAP2 family protein [Actinomycetota bacterium]